MEEIWKDIKDYEGLYQISNLGRVKRLKRLSTDGLKKYVDEEKMLKPWVSNMGYYTVCLRKNGTSKKMSVHRLISCAFIPNPYNLYTVNHKDGNKLNNSISNLEWMLLADNIRHGHDTGLYSCMKKVVVICKKDNTAFEINGMAKASRFMGHTSSYVYTAICENRFENKEYKWEII